MRSSRSWAAGLASVAFTPDGSLIVSGGREGTIRAWDSTTGGAAGQFRTSGVSVLALVFSPDGRLLAVAGRGGVIDLFAVHTTQGRRAPATARRERLVLDEAHRISIGVGGAFMQVSDVAFSPGGSVIASTYDTGVLLWDVETGRRITGVLGGYRGLIFDVEFSPDGSTLLVAGNDEVTDLAGAPADGANGADTSELGSVSLRGIGLVEMRARACAIAQRSLTAAEWARYVGGTPGQTCANFPPASPISNAVSPEPTVTAAPDR